MFRKRLHPQSWSFRKPPLIDYHCEGPGGDRVAEARWLGPGYNKGQPSAVQASVQAGRVTVNSGLGDEMPRDTLASVLRQAGLKRGKR